MIKLTYLMRLREIDRLISTRSTGNTEVFAKKLGISRSQLFADLKELRELGAPIFYSRVGQTYFYKYPTTFSLYFQPISTADMANPVLFDEKLQRKSNK